MYPYLDFFNERETQDMEYMNDPEAGDQDLRSHLNARTGSERAHHVEPPPQEPIDIIHEVPVYPQGARQIPYPYTMNPMGVPDLNYPWWQHTPQYYPHPPPYQAPPSAIRTEAVHTLPHPANAVSRTLEAQMDSIDGTEYDSPPRRSAFERLRPSTREHLGEIKRGDIINRGANETLRWERPKNNTIAIDVDGSINATTKVAGCGGIARNQEGSWQGGFMFKTSLARISEIEAVAVLKAMEWAWSKGFRNIEIKSDSRETVKKT
nr:ribonuclease H [Ipomoea batatas]